MASADPAIGALLAALDERPEYRWSETDIERMGFELSVIRRSFKRQFEPAPITFRSKCSFKNL